MRVFCRQILKALRICTYETKISTKYKMSAFSLLKENPLIKGLNKNFISLDFETKTGGQV